MPETYGLILNYPINELNLKTEDSKVENKIIISNTEGKGKGSTYLSFSFGKQN